MFVRFSFAESHRKRKLPAPRDRFHSDGQAIVNPKLGGLL